jgi:hypothetical protein
MRPKMIATQSPREIEPDRRGDEDAHAAACSVLARLVGSLDAAVCWDSTHHLQGHAVVAGCELVVIAPRDRTHVTIVVTADDWDKIRRASGDQRHALLCTCPITSRRRLREVLATAC